MKGGYFGHLPADIRKHLHRSTEQLGVARRVFVVEAGAQEMEFEDVVVDRPPSLSFPLNARRGGEVLKGDRRIPDEVPIAFSYGGSSHAVMMGTPADIDDFAIGFSLTEGIISDVSQIASIEPIYDEQGIDVQISLVDDAADALRLRRRHMAGPVGCGLCGIESIEQAVRQVSSVSSVELTLNADLITSAVAQLNDAQPLFKETRAVHGAGFFVPGRGIVAVREDVGRHNALDKLCGAVTRSGIPGSSGAVVVTSRLSVEMVQKAALLGSAMLIAISAPTALAIRTAEEAGMTLVALVRGNDFDVFTHGRRVFFSEAR